ncbi:MAG: lysoplasmalogenase [Anaerolineae bacterium]|jgi:hypothetical protein|nr:lysoplasmalogenase [Anaerolineae bacterium]
MLLMWGLWAALLFGGFLFGTTWPEGHRRMPIWTRMASSAVLAIAAWIWAGIGPESPLAIPIAIGMTFGWLGDLLMAQLLLKVNYVLAGMSAFGIGHLAYLYGLIQVRSESMSFAPIGIAWIIGAIGWWIVVYWRNECGKLHYAALPYTLLLSSTAGVSAAIALSQPQYGWIAIGAALFLISDTILAMELFRPVKFPLINDAVWLTYGPGQMLIVFGLFFAGGV